MENLLDDVQMRSYLDADEQAQAEAMTVKEAMEHRINSVRFNEENNQYSAKRRLFYAAEAMAYDDVCKKGGKTRIREITGCAKDSIDDWAKELKGCMTIRGNNVMIEIREPQKRGRKPFSDEKKAERRADAQSLISELINLQGNDDTDEPLSWNTKSQRFFTNNLRKNGIIIDKSEVKEILRNKGFIDRKKLKIMNMNPNQDYRNKQFKYINEKTKQYINAKLPVIFVECLTDIDFSGEPVEYMKKIDPQEYKYCPDEVNRSLEEYKNLPITDNTSFIPVKSIQKWWDDEGRSIFIHPRSMYIIVFGLENLLNDSPVAGWRRWFDYLYRFSKKTHMDIEVSCFPYGASKWNKIDQRIQYCIIDKKDNEQRELLKVSMMLINSPDDAGKYEADLKLFTNSKELLPAIYGYSDEKHNKYPPNNYLILHNEKYIVYSHFLPIKDNDIMIGIDRKRISPYKEYNPPTDGS